MILPSLKSFLLGKQYNSIEHFSLNNEEKIALLLVEKKKGELVIFKKDKISYSEKLSEKCSKNIPLFLVVNTNQVLHKEITGIDFSDEKLLNKGFPNTNWDDFYFEIWRLKTKSIIAISRKIYIEELLSNYRKQEISIAGISLGVCSIAEIINYSEEKELNTNHQTISFVEDNQIIKSNSVTIESNYYINGLQIQGSNLLAFAGILRLLFNSTTNTGNLINYSGQLYENYNQQSFFLKGIKITIGALLAILVINFFIFTHYFKLAQEASENLILGKFSVEEILKTKKRIKEKEQKAKNIIAVSSSQSSLFINEITKRIPSSILLTELMYNPLEKTIKPKEPILTQEKIITLSGTTINNSGFTNWVEAIEQLKWIDQVIISRFGKNELNETEFSIKVILK